MGPRPGVANEAPVAMARLGGPSALRTHSPASRLVCNLASSSAGALDALRDWHLDNLDHALTLQAKTWAKKLIGADFTPLGEDAARCVGLAALFSLLAPHVDDAGMLDWGSLGRAFGASGAAVIGVLQATAARAPARRQNFGDLASAVQVLGRLHPRQQALLIVDRLLRSDDVLPRSVPTLDAVKACVPDDRFADEGLVAAQHLLPTSLAFFEALIAKGMRPNRIHVLGTPYASNPLVVAVLCLMGVDAVPGRDREFTHTASMHERRMEGIHHFLYNRAHALHEQRPPQGYIVVDDGGLLQLAIMGKTTPVSVREPDRSHYLAALSIVFDPSTHVVEQTTRGITEIKKHGSRFATVDVPGSPGKRAEGAVIAVSLIDCLLTALAQRDKLDARRIAVISAGTVGLAMAEQLQALGFTVTLVDRDATKRAHVAAKGFAVAEALTAELAGCVDVIYGCTGTTSLSGEALRDFHGVVLSGSSMAVEGDLAQITSFRTRHLDAVNRLRPANFDGTGHENLTKHQIGITRALIFAAVAQRITRSVPGFVPVDAALHDVAVAAWTGSGGDKVKTPPMPGRRGVSSLRGHDNAMRPDVWPAKSAPTHWEWVTFLAGLQRPVCPRPTELTRVRASYFFEDVDGSVRLVDTRTHTPSLRVALPSVPVECTFVSSASGAPVLVQCGRGADAELFEVDSGTARVKRVGPSDGLAAVYRPAEGPEQPRWFAFYAGNRLLVHQHGDWREVPLPPGVTRDNSFLMWPEPGSLLALERETAKLHRLSGEDQVEVPHNWVSIEAASHVPEPDIGMQPYLAVGRTAAGELEVAFLAPANAAPPCRLPAGAIFRDIRTMDEPGRAEIAYTIAGESVEIEHRHKIQMDLLKDLRAGPAKTSLMARRQAAQPAVG